MKLKLKKRQYTLIIDIAITAYISYRALYFSAMHSLLIIIISILTNVIFKIIESLFYVEITEDEFIIRKYLKLKINLKDIKKVEYAQSATNLFSKMKVVNVYYNNFDVISVETCEDEMLVDFLNCKLKSETIYLREFNKYDLKKQYDFVKDLRSENGFENIYFGIEFTQFKKYVNIRKNSKLGKKLKENFVPDTQYFLYDNDTIVGVFNMRHYLNDFLREGPGHIGYCVKEEYRNKGYATRGLNLVIKKLKNILIEDMIYMSCSKNNEHSLKVQLKNGAFIEKENEKYYYTRIKVVK